MEIQEIEKQKMDALTALAETNVLVSRSREVFNTLKAEESAYIVEREAKALARIQAVLTESKEVLNETLQNYNALHELANNTAIYSQFLDEAYEEFKKLKENFLLTTQEWESDIKDVEEHLSEVKKQIKIDTIRIKKDQESIERQKKNLKDEERRIKDQRETLERAFNRLKQ